MKIPYGFLSIIGLMAGCVAGPEDVARQEQNKAEERQVAEHPAESKVTQTSGQKGTSVSAGDFRTTDSGLKYKVVNKGTGARAKASSTVVCHYRGWLDDGTEFDSSYKRNEPTEFPLNGVIAGWTEGLQLINEGGKIELEIPSDLGYGPRGMPAAGIPGGATLHFEVELIKVR